MELWGKIIFDTLKTRFYPFGDYYYILMKCLKNGKALKERSESQSRTRIISKKAPVMASEHRKHRRPSSIQTCFIPSKDGNKEVPRPLKMIQNAGIRTTYAPPKCRVLTIFCAGKVTVTNSCSYGPTNTYKWDELTPITEIIYDYMSL